MVNELPRRWRFAGISNITFNYAARYERDPKYKAATLPGLGLIETFDGLEGFALSIDKQASNCKPWERFKSYVHYLNQEGPGSYKVLYITRHGQGFHNAFKAQVGSETWEDHWSHLDGDGTTVWADSKLDEEGKKQVAELGQIWSSLVSEAKVPLPGTIYTSPLTRCLETTDAMFREVFRENATEFRPNINETLRGRVSYHTFNRRSGRSWISSNFPDFKLPSLSEEDNLWTAGGREAAGALEERAQKALEDIFTNDSSQFVALTTHSYVISAIIAVLGMKAFRVREGSSIAILVRGVKLE